VPEHSNITKEQFKTIQDNTRWEQFLRKFEIDKVLDGFEKDHFDKALELGCGSGKYSKHLAHYCKKLIALEYNKDRLTEQSNDKITFIVGDAQDLSRFSDGEMDLIFSSNLIEHLPRLNQCLAECRRIIKQEGLIIHTVPNRTWQIFRLLLYYPYVLKTILSRIFSAKKTTAHLTCEGAKPALDSNLRPLKNKVSLKGGLLPKTHGISKSHFGEFENWRQKYWTKIFESNKLEVVDIIRLPFYFGLGYNFRIILRLGNYLGLSSSTAFVLREVKK